MEPTQRAASLVAFAVITAEIVWISGFTEMG